MSSEVKMKLRFAEFAESVEVGLADYFVGPYGSYANPTAAKAGLSAKAPQTSLGSLDSKTEIKTQINCFSIKHIVSFHQCNRIGFTICT